MIERRVLKEKEKREREKWGGDKMEGGARKGRRAAGGKGAEEELNPAFTLKKKSHFLQSQIKKKKKKGKS